MHRSPHEPARRRVWLLTLLLVPLVAGHGLVFYYVSSHPVLSAAILSVAIILLVIKHLGLLGWVYALLRRGRSRN